MHKNDYDKFVSLMQGIAENYSQSLTAHGIALRFKLLESFSIEEITKATMSLLVTRKYTTMPTVADFFEHLGGGSVEDKAQVEAGKVLQAIALHGGYTSVVFDNPVTQAVIQQAYGGWVKLCEDCGSQESEKWFRKDFATTWAAYSRQNVEVFGSLSGKEEINNQASGFDSCYKLRIAVVGCPEKAKAILEKGERKKKELLMSNLQKSIPLFQQKVV